MLVDLTADGVSIAGTHEKMGLRATSEAELAFDDVRVDPGDVLLCGEPDSNAAFRTLIGHINHERCGNAAMCIGAAQGALEYAIGYLNERVVGGRPLADLQGLQWKIADMGTQLESARLLLKRAVHLAGPHGTPPPLETAMAKSRREPRGEVRVRRGDPAARRIRLLTRVPGRARLPRHPRALHRCGHGRDPAELHRDEPAARGGTERPRLDPTGAVTHDDVRRL